MVSSIAGAIKRGHFLARTRVVRRLSQIPQAILLIVFAVAGAIKKISAQHEREIWSSFHTFLSSNCSVKTSSFVIASNKIGEINFHAFGERTAFTEHPFFTRRLAISRDL